MDRGQVSRRRGPYLATLQIKRGGELGSVCIQQYVTYLKVGMFVPGVSEYERRGEGDHHVWPEKHRDFIVSDDADACFDNNVQEVYAAGWQNYDPEYPNG